MQFRIIGYHGPARQRVDIAFDAPDAQTALSIALSHAIVVEALFAVPSFSPAGASTPPPLALNPPPAPPSRQIKGGPRSWPIILAILILGSAPFFPPLALWCGAILIALVVLLAIRPVRGALCAWFRIDRARPFRSGFKLAAISLCGAVMMGASFGGRELQRRFQEDWEQRAAAKIAHDKARADANEKVASEIKRATDAIHLQKLEAAKEMLRQALSQTEATNRAEAQKLLDAVEFSRDRLKIRRALVQLSDSDFEAFVNTMKLPVSMAFSIDALNQNILVNAKAELDQARAGRAEKVKLAAAEQTRRVQEAKEQAEVERKQREEKAAAEAAAKTVSDKIGAWVAAKEFVTRRLKAPSTADFGSVFGDYQRPEKCVLPLGANAFRASGWVDAENSFGAKIRNDFVCDLHASGEDWICDSCEITSR